MSPRLVRVTLAGSSLAGLVVDRPAASVRVLLPSPGSDDLVMPAWNGNEFLLPDGRRPIIRTFTPPLVDSAQLDLDIDIVLHGRGPASEWAARARRGAVAAVSGPGRGYEIDPAASEFLLAGDEAAIPAIRQLLGGLVSARVQVHIEAGAPDARLAIGQPPGATVTWWDRAPGAPPGEALVAAVRGADFADDARVWVAGEAAAMQRIRRYLFDERALSRSQATVRGYWKSGRTGDVVDDA